MYSRRKKYEVSDPGYYDQLISDQKEQVHKNKTDPDVWLELGCLFEARVAMTNDFVKKNFFLQYSFFITLIAATGAVYFSIQQLSLWGISTILALFSVIILIFIWNTRYPKSGEKYFKNAIALDSNCGDAYLYLGKIALRNNKKTKAWLFLEKAIQLNASNSGGIKRELKLLYEKEFIAFFDERLKQENKKQKIIDSQLDKIKSLYSQNSNLQKQIEYLNDKIEQIKWKTGHQAKLIAKEMAEKKFIRLTTEIMESKSDLEKQSLEAAVINTEKIIGKQNWQMLPDKVKKYLSTAEQVYTVLKAQKENSDYSLVGMELCKTLETMLNQILVTPFVKAIKKNQSEFLRVNQIAVKNKKPSYFTYLAMVVDEVNYPEISSLTLGQYHFVLKRVLEGDYALQEYADFLKKIHVKSGVIIGENFLYDFTIVTKQYRNAIVHKSLMNRDQCKHLRELIFAGENSLLLSLITHYHG